MFNLRYLRPSVLLMVLVAGGIATPTSHAQVLISSLLYTQSFDTPILPDSSTGSGITWTNNSTLVGYYASDTPNNGTSADITNIVSDDGGKNAKGLYSYGAPTNNSAATSSDERALGILTSGSNDTGRIGIQFKNTTGSTLSGFTLSYRGEQWRRGGVNASTLRFGYLYSATDDTSKINVTGYTSAATLDFLSPNLGSPTDIDGNTFSATKTGTISGLTWKNNEYLWVRFENANGGGSDQGLAIDDLNVTFQPVPTPPAMVSLMIGCTVGTVATGAIQIKKRANKTKTH